MLAAVTDVLQNLSGLIQEKCMCHQHPVQYLFALLSHSSTKVDRGPAVFKTCAFWACLCIGIQQADGNRGSRDLHGFMGRRDFAHIPLPRIQSHVFPRCKGDWEIWFLTDQLWANTTVHY